MVSKKERLKLKKIFNLEYKRARLAKKGRYEQLKKEYKSKRWEISDLNTSTFWDWLNSKNRREENDPMTADKLKTVASLLKDKKTYILDICFGSARLERIVLQNNQFRWFGVDISPVSVKLANKEFPGHRFTIGSLQKLDYQDNLFDYVIALELLEHIRPSKIFGSLKEIRRVLKRRGKLIVSVPLNEGLEELLLIGENPNAHMRIYSEELVKTELKISGFKILWSKKLYAFRNFYGFKTFIVKTIVPFIRQPNDLIILAERI